MYNVGGRDRMTIRGLAEEICSLTGSTLSIGALQQPQFQDIKVSPKCVELDIQKVCSEFDLPPFKPFKEGLERTIMWNVQR